MKITKYNQATLLIETKGKRILVDPSDINYRESLLEKWINIDYILITHKHGDHCYLDAVNKIILRDKAIVYTTREVVNNHNIISYKIIKENDVVDLGDIKIEVTHAIHGYLTGMRERNIEILENVGFIIDDGTKRLYITSDTINFYNQYKCDILCMPFNGNGLTLGLIDGTSFIKGIKPSLVLPIHMQHPNPIMNPDKEVLSVYLEQNEINYKILDLYESIEV